MQATPTRAPVHAIETRDRMVREINAAQTFDALTALYFDWIGHTDHGETEAAPLRGILRDYVREVCYDSGIPCPVWPLPASFDRFDICGAHLALENDFNLGGWIRARPSNARRRESTGVQLRRIGFAPGIDSCCAFEYLQNDNQRAIYVNALRAFGLPLDRDNGTHAAIWAFIDSQE